MGDGRKGDGEDGGTNQGLEMMYKALIYMVIMYGRKIWVVTVAMMMVLGGFHHSIAIQVAGMLARRGDGGEWEWASVDAALEVTRIWPIRE